MMMMSNNVSNPDPEGEEKMNDITHHEESPDSPPMELQDEKTNVPDVMDNASNSPSGLNIVEETEDVEMNDDGNLCIDASTAEETPLDDTPSSPSSNVNEIVRHDADPASPTNDYDKPAPASPTDPANDVSPSSPVTDNAPVSTADPVTGPATAPEEPEQVETPVAVQVPAERPASSEEKMEIAQEEESQSQVEDGSGDGPSSPPDAPSSPVGTSSSPTDPSRFEDSNSATVHDFQDAKEQSSNNDNIPPPASSVDDDESKEASVSKDVPPAQDSDTDKGADNDTRDTAKESAAEESMDATDSKPEKEIDPIDLEDGELPDSDDEDGDDKEKPKKKTPDSIIELEKKLKKSLEELERSKNKEKEREKKKKEREREKEKEKEKERQREKEKAKEKEKQERKKRRHSDEDSGKPSKSKRSREDEVIQEAETPFQRGGGSSPAVKPAFEGNDSFRGRHGQDFEEPDDFGGRKGDGRRPREDTRDMGGRGGPPGRRGGISHGMSRKDDHRPPKTDMICSYFMQGKCQKSAEECNFSHDAVPPRKMELCKFWMMDCCAKKEKCLYLHNDFPCKFYHTGLVCKLADKCKFSHNPLSEGTKAVLLKHIETAPKEILGDFPRLNRQGALNLINKMEAKINRRQERHHSPPSHHQHHSHHNNHHNQQHQQQQQDDRNRRTRWEHPTRDDQEKLHELMEEAGIGNLYNEATEERSPPSKSQLPINQQPGLLPTPLLPTPLPANPLTNVLPNVPLAGAAPSMQSCMPNALLGDPQFLQTLFQSLPNATPQQIQQAAQLLFAQQLIMPTAANPAVQQVDNRTELPTGSPGSGVASSTNGNSAPPPSMDLDHLPKMQQELFKRVQSMQIKKEQEIKQEEDAPPPLDDDWYSDEDDDEAKDSKSESKSSINALLSKIRQSSQMQHQEDVKPPVKPPVIPPVTAPSTSSLQDVDFRSTLFGDTDFRLPPLRSADSFQDVDLRSRDPSGFKKLPEIPAAEIFAGPSSHSGIPWKVVVVAGVRKIDYSHAKNTMQSSQILSDPRLTNRGESTPSGPASPPPSSGTPVSIGSSPIGIPSSSDFADPRMRKSGGKSSKDSHGRSSMGGNESPGQQALLQNNPFFNHNQDISPALAQIMQAAVAAAGNPAAQNAFMPNMQPNPFMQPDLMSMTAAAQVAAALQQQASQNQNMNAPRPPFHQPKSSWESRYQQGSGGVTPPI